MFVDILNWNKSHSDKIWRYQIWAAFFQKRLACYFGLKFEISLKLQMVKLTLEILFGDVLQWNQSDFDHIWVKQICAAAKWDFFQRG